MIERYQRCTGLRMPLWKDRQIELWFCPCGASIPPHVHRHVDSVILYLLGSMRVTVEQTTRDVFGPLRRRESTGRWMLAVKKIPAGVRHSAKVLGAFAVFLNYERCHGRRVSAARDFVLVP